MGNFGNGLIHAFGLFSGVPRGVLLGEQPHPIQIDDLWAQKFGTATTGGTGTLLFSAGINDEKDGLVGAINPFRSRPCSRGCPVSRSRASPAGAAAAQEPLPSTGKHQPVLG